ncbi:hypothetical protein HPB52_005978 [Rhipicephalus sanguineus]|uniref:Uncharacterized protein n=1 Tax=Rhipicephalus sanguineus TaxID=34632 RepID=A0A9D4SRK4_RHISA|nr:hypothetical protein HPB52_005978 [Rhipicephalus sanguineus]
MAACSKAKRSRNFLTSEECWSLECLSHRADLVIKPTDKGGTIVILGMHEDLPPTDLVSPPYTEEQWEALLFSTDREVQTRILARAEDIVEKHGLAAYVA